MDVDVCLKARVCNENNVLPRRQTLLQQLPKNASSISASIPVWEKVRKSITNVQCHERRWDLSNNFVQSSSSEFTSELL